MWLVAKGTGKNRWKCTTTCLAVAHVLCSTVTLIEILHGIELDTIWNMVHFEPSGVNLELFQVHSRRLKVKQYPMWVNYHKISNISCTKSKNLNDSHLVLQSSLPNPLKPGVKSRMKMYLEQRRQAMPQLHLSDQQFNCLLRCVFY